MLGRGTDRPYTGIWEGGRGRQGAESGSFPRVERRADIVVGGKMGSMVLESWSQSWQNILSCCLEPSTTFPPEKGYAKAPAVNFLTSSLVFCVLPGLQPEAVQLAKSSFIPS